MPQKKPKPIAQTRARPGDARPVLDPKRMAIAAIERIKTALTRAGHAERIGGPATMAELAARADVLGRTPPPSYFAALRKVGAIGEPDRFLSSVEMRATAEKLAANWPARERGRYVPFAVSGDRPFCFDTASSEPDGELAVVEWLDGMPEPRFRNFAEWLDGIADAREDSLDHAASLPPRLRLLLLDLGFRFDFPLVGRLETGDAAAIEALLGPSLTAEVRGDVDRLFDSSGKASVTLNVDEFTIAASLRTGMYVFPAEDVFRWLRSFRDENFFSDTTKVPSHPDQVRDLRRALREPPLALRGVAAVSVLPARRHRFRAASGANTDDFHVLARTASTSERSPSLVLHVTGGAIVDAHVVDEPLTALHVGQDGTIWGLSMAGTAICFANGEARTFPLRRPTRGRAWWYGIGGNGDRVFVWGAGAILAFDGDAFSPFEPDANVGEAESILALHTCDSELIVLVSGDRVGGIGRFDGRRWAPIPEGHLLKANLADLDVWRGASLVLGRDGRLWRAEASGKPRPLLWGEGKQAFYTEAGWPRPMHGVCCFDGGALLASDGGVISVGAGDPIFHSAGDTREAARLSRVGGARGALLRPGGARAGDVADSGIVAMIGPHLWVWRSGAFEVVDVREW